MIESQRCATCGEFNPRTFSDLCGICEIVEARKRGERSRWGVQGPGMVPKHFNYALGEHIEDYDHLKRRVRELDQAGLVEGDI